MLKHSCSGSKAKAAVMVAGTLVLSGCGGASGDAPMTDGPADADMQMMKIDEARQALARAETGIATATTDAEMLAAYQAVHAAANTLFTVLETNGGSTTDIAAAARKAGEAKGMVDNLTTKIADADGAVREMMAATVAKLYAGISAPSGEFAADGTITFADTDRAAGYNEAGTEILLSVGDGFGTARTAVSATLSEDKDAVAGTLLGWAGKRYADPASGDMYEAMVYSNVEAPTQDKKFGGAAANDEFEYTLTNGAVTAVDGCIMIRQPTQHFTGKDLTRSFILDLFQ